MSKNRQINLLRGRVPSSRRRHLYYWSIISYIAIMGILLIIIFHGATTRMVEALNYRSEIQHMENTFIENNPKYDDVISSVQQLNKQLGAAATELEHVEAVVHGRSMLTHILVGLADALPPDMHLMDISLEESKNELRFSVIVPTSSTDQAIQPAQLLAIWNSAPELSDQVSVIQSTLSERRRIFGEQVIMHRFHSKLNLNGS